jgi:hypothetical protein
MAETRLEITNNILVISWRLVLLMEETGENHRPVATLSYIVVLSSPCLSGIPTHYVSGEGIDGIGSSFKSNRHGGYFSHYIQGLVSYSAT